MANKAGINNTKGLAGDNSTPNAATDRLLNRCKANGNPHTLSLAIVICSQRNQCEHSTSRGLHVLAGSYGRSRSIPPHFAGPRSLQPKRTILRGQYQAARRPIKELNNLFLHVCLSRLQRMDVKECDVGRGARAILPRPRQTAPRRRRRLPKFRRRRRGKSIRNPFSPDPVSIFSSSPSALRHRHSRQTRTSAFQANPKPPNMPSTTTQTKVPQTSTNFNAYCIVM
jgi:hypothetical protein